jgi:hypothetical protein
MDFRLSGYMLNVFPRMYLYPDDKAPLSKELSMVFMQHPRDTIEFRSHISL